MITVLTSAKGSPGVTTTALALTLVWPRQVLLVEADVCAGSSILAGYLRSQVEHTRGLAQLHHTARQRDLTLHSVWGQTIELAPGRFLLPGLANPAQAASLTTTWPQLIRLLTALTDTDVIVDAGRLGTAFEAGPQLLSAATTIGVLTRLDLPSIYAASTRLPALHNLDGPQIGLITVGDPTPYSAREVASHLSTPLLAALPHDPSTAAAYSHGTTPRRMDKAPLTSGIRSLTNALGAGASPTAAPL